MNSDHQSETQHERNEDLISSDSVLQAVNDLMLSDSEISKRTPSTAEIKKSLWASKPEINTEPPPVETKASPSPPASIGNQEPVDQDTEADLTRKRKPKQEPDNFFLKLKRNSWQISGLLFVIFVAIDCGFQGKISEKYILLPVITIAGSGVGLALLGLVSRNMKTTVFSIILLVMFFLHSYDRGPALFIIDSISALLGAK